MMLIKNIAQLVGLLRLALFVWLTWDAPNHWWWLVVFMVANFITGSICEYRLAEARAGRSS